MLSIIKSTDNSIKLNFTENGGGGATAAFSGVCYFFI
jgi:hypothetical protein